MDSAPGKQLHNNNGRTAHEQTYYELQNVACACTGRFRHVRTRPVLDHRYKGCTSCVVAHFNQATSASKPSLNYGCKD